MNLLKRHRPPRLFKEPQVSFFIFASPKSGTTWMQHLLSRHPETVCGESRAFGDYYEHHPLSSPHPTPEKHLTILSHHFAPSVGGLGPTDTAFYRNTLF